MDQPCEADFVFLVGIRRTEVLAADIINVELPEESPTFLSPTVIAPCFQGVRSRVKSETTRPSVALPPSKKRERSGGGERREETPFSASILSPKQPSLPCPVVVLVVGLAVVAVQKGKAKKGTTDDTTF